MNKSDIVHLLQAHHGYRHYLELRTTFTGPDCRVDPARFDTFQKIAYRCPLGNDGVPREGCLDRLAATPDIALLDPWHSHAQSLQDMEEVFARLAPGGAMVCHDCWPQQDIVDPEGWRGLQEGGVWSGETFAAYADFVTGHSDLDYLTVDAEYGCGVIFKRPGAQPDPALVAGWQAHRSHAWLAHEGRELLRLTRPAEFVRLLGGNAAAHAEALVIVATRPDAPCCIELDVPPRFRLGFFDYSGCGHAPDLGLSGMLRLSRRTAGKGDLLAHLAAQDLGEFDYIAIIDDDILLSASGINRMLFLARLHGLALFQASLSHDSFISHPHLAQRPSLMLRETTFVETMMPFFSNSAFQLARDSFGESASAWGLDFLWSSRIRQHGGTLAVIDCVMAKHVRPINSHTWRFADGSTPPDELRLVLARHGLEGYEIK